MSIDYNERLHQTYDKARELSPENLSLWTNALAEFLQPGIPLSILDLGCGTGRFSGPLAERFGAAVVGLDPSEKMLAKARAKGGDVRVYHVAGRAEEIPCARHCFDAAFLSMVLHHVRSIPEALRELRRTIKPGGFVFARNAFQNRLDGFRWYEFFPSARAIDNARLPSIEQVVAAFRVSEFEFVTHRVVVQQMDKSLLAQCERMKLKGLSTFEFLSEEEFQEGIRTMEQAARAEVEPKPVMDPIDMLVFRVPR